MAPVEPTCVEVSMVRDAAVPMISADSPPAGGIAKEKKTERAQVVSLQCCSNQEGVSRASCVIRLWDCDFVQFWQSKKLTWFHPELEG